MQKSYFTILFSLFLTITLTGQEKQILSLDEAYSRLESRYPSLKNAGLLNAIYQKEQDLIDSRRLPRLLVKAEARLMSESVGPTGDTGAIPFPIDLPLYSAKSYVEGQYTVLDGGFDNAQKQWKEAILKADQQQIESNKYGLKERINRLCTTLQLLRAQEQLIETSKNNVKARKESVSAAVEYGVSLESELTKLDVKELELEAARANLEYGQRAVIEILEELTGLDISEEVEIVFPTLDPTTNIPSLKRPELEQFSLQKEAILAKSVLIDAQNKPLLSVYAQAGIGVPNQLNLFDNDLSPFAILGAQFSWKITDWKRNKIEKERLSLEATKVQYARESFEFEMQNQVPEYLVEVDRIKQQINYDKKIISLQSKILEASAAQLDEGVITTTEFIIQLNEELKSRQNLAVHEVELLKTKLDFYNLRGAF
jgi:outer membrane protein TolC